MAKIGEDLLATVVTEKGILWDTRKPGYQVSIEGRRSLEAAIGAGEYAEVEMLFGADRVKKMYDALVEQKRPATAANIKKLLSGSK